MRIPLSFRALGLFVCFSLLPVGCDGGTQAMGGPDEGGQLPDLTMPPAGPVPATYTALHYAVAFDLTTRIAHIDATLKINMPGNCVTIGFKPAAVMDAKLDGVAASDVVVDAKNAQLTACRADRFLWGAMQNVVLSTTAEVPKNSIAVKAQMGLSSRKDAAGNLFTYLLSWVNGCDHHGTCDGAADRFATFTFTVAHPMGTQVFCPGTITHGATSTVCDFAFQGGPTYSAFGIMAGSSWSPTSLGNWNGVDVTLHDYQVTGIAAAFDKKASQSHFGWMQTTFGTFPYGKELRFVVAPTYWLGFEHPGNIALSEVLATAPSNYTNGLRHTAMHEVTHQWAGNHATLADTYDFFWKESMAEYLTFVFEDEQIAHADAQQTAAAWKDLAKQAHYYPVPAEKPPLFTYYGDAYGPGPMVLLRQIEAMYGRKTVIDALKTVIGTAAPRAISTDDIRKALEATTGASLANYFNAWIRGQGAPAWPLARVATSDAGGGAVQVAVTVSTSDGVARGCAFKVQLTSGDGKMTYDVPVNLGPDAMAFTPVTVKPGFVVASAVVDPYSECLIWQDTSPGPKIWEPMGRSAGGPWVAPGWGSGESDTRARHSFLRR